jgi:uncharacterized membrane protein YhaH (DUF805 family)
MLDYVFGLNARLGRLQFIGASIALAIVMALICFVIAVNGLVHFPSGTTRSQLSELSWTSLGWPIICTAAFATWATVSLQAMRIRDIGWDPVIVIGGWIALTLVNIVVSTKLPGLGHLTTMVSGIANLVMTGILLFWPGSDA